MLSSSVFAGYLTYELSTVFSPDVIRSMSKFKEIKIFFCESTGLPVFESGRNSGPLSKLGLPKVGFRSIHVRVDLLKALPKSGQFVTTDENNEWFQKQILLQIFEQVEVQIARHLGPACITEKVKLCVDQQQEEINELLRFIDKVGGKNHEPVFH